MIAIGVVCCQLSVALAGNKEIIQAVQKYPSKLYGTIGQGIALVLATTSLDYEVKREGWTVDKLKSGKSYIVRYNFSLDGTPKYAEWFYGAGSGIVEPRNDWAMEIQE